MNWPAPVPAPPPGRERVREGLALWVRAAALVVAAVGLEVLFTRVTSLPAERYAAPILVAETAMRIARLADPFSIAVVAGLGMAVLLAAWRRSAGPGWGDLEGGTRLRIFAGLVATLLAWVFATRSYNFHLDTAHAVDRALVAVLAGLVWWRPMFLFPFLPVVLPLIGQYAYPIGGFSWASPLLLVRVLALVAGFWMLRAITTRMRTADFVFVLCCLVAAHYWVSGVEKVRLGWLGGDRVEFLLPATYAAGWLAFLDRETIGRLTAALASVSAPMWIGTLILECGALFALARRATLVTLLACWVVLHVLIFPVSGILFWEWMLIDAAIPLLFFTRGAPAWPIFTRAHLAISVVLIGGGALWFRPLPLAWIDAPVSYAYRITGTGESGRTYALHPRFFAPYSYPFTLGDFTYLHDEPRLRITWGATHDRALVAALRRARTPRQVLAVEEVRGTPHHDAARAAAFDDFVRSFIAGWNRRGGDRGPWFGLHPPADLWTFARGTAPRGDDPLTQVDVREVTSFFDGRNYVEIRSLAVRSITIEPAADGQPEKTDR